MKNVISKQLPSCIFLACSPSSGKSLKCVHKLIFDFKYIFLQIFRNYYYKLPWFEILFSFSVHLCSICIFSYLITFYLASYYYYWNVLLNSQFHSINFKIMDFLKTVIFCSFHIVSLILDMYDKWNVFLNITLFSLYRFHISQVISEWLLRSKWYCTKFSKKLR